MGYFSFKTADTGETIWNMHSAQSRDGTRPVFLLQPGGQAPLREESYNGYGDFGGVDVFVWIGQNNLPDKRLATMSQDQIRDAGHAMFFGRDGAPEMAFPPKFSFDENADYYRFPASPMCDTQGYDEDLEPYSRAA